MQTRGLVLVGVLGAVCATAGAQRNAGLERRLEGMSREAAVAGAHWGVVVEGMDGGVIAGVHEGELFEPASNNKLPTTAAAMDLLGPADTAVTRVVASTPVENGTVAGDLVLEGGGDANLAVEDVPYETPDARKARRAAEAVEGSAAAAARADREAHPLRAMERMADAVVAAGVKVVRGDVVGDDSRWVWEPYAYGWPQDDQVWYYGAPVSALTMHDSQIEVRIRPGATVGAPAVVELEPGLPTWFAVDTTALLTGERGSGAKLDLGKGLPDAGGPPVLRAWGTIGVDAKEDRETVAVADPAAWAARTLKEMLVARGVDVEGAARSRHRLPTSGKGFEEQEKEPVTFAPAAAGAQAEAGKVLAEVQSPELLPDVVLTNKVSQNLHAEALLMRLGERFGEQSGPERGSRAQGVRVVRQWLLTRVGVAPGDVSLWDGSGLSLQDLITPRALAGVLQYAAGKPWGAAWRTSLPVAGVDGTLSGRFVTVPGTKTPSPAKGQMQAKSGTVGGVRTLSGYLRCRSGREVVVSVMVNDHLPGGLVERTAAPDGGPVEREVMDRMVEAVYRAE